MYDSLKKYGMSDTKHSLKIHLSSNKKPQTHTRQPLKKTFPNTQVTPFSLDDSKPVKNIQNQQTDPLSTIINLLSNKSHTVCQNYQTHDRNPLRFICMNEFCLSRLGCSYCFLEKHNGHPRQSISHCMKQLEELKQLTDISQKQSIELLTVKKKQLEKTIDEQFYQIKTTFQEQIEQLRTKIKSNIDKQFNTSAINIQKQSGVSIGKLTEHEQDALLERVRRMSRVHVQEYVKNEVRVASELAEYAGIYNEFLDEVNLALLQFFSTFAVAVPKFTSFTSPLPPPQIFTPLLFAQE